MLVPAFSPPLPLPARQPPDILIFFLAPSLSVQAVPLIHHIDAADTLGELDPDPDPEPEPDPHSCLSSTPESDSSSANGLDDGLAASSRSVPRHRDARTGAPCLKKGGISARASELVLSHTACPTVCPTVCSLPGRLPPTFRYYPNRSKAVQRPQRQTVRFDQSHAPTSGWTYSRCAYDRSSIQSTQGRGSSLDLSMRRCRSFRGDDSSSSDEEENSAFHSPLAIRVAKASASSDYFGCSWSTRLQAGQVVGYDTSTRLQPLALNELTLDGPTRLNELNAAPYEPTEEVGRQCDWSPPSIRSFGALSTPALEDMEVITFEDGGAPFSSSAASNRGEDRTPQPSPSLAHVSTLEGYFTSCALHLRSASLPSTAGSGTGSGEGDSESMRTVDMTPRQERSQLPSLPLLNVSGLSAPSSGLVQEHEGPIMECSSTQGSFCFDDDSSFCGCSGPDSGFTSATTACSSDAGTASPPLAPGQEHGCAHTYSTHSCAACLGSTPRQLSRRSSGPPALRRKLNVHDLSLSDTIPPPRPWCMSSPKEVESGPNEADHTVLLPSPAPRKKKKSSKRRSSLPSVLAGFGDDGEGALGGF